MQEKITLDMLAQYSVSVKKQKYMTVEGTEYPIGEPWRRAYVNSVQGRQQVVNELPQAQVNAIMAVWGDVPTVTEEVTE